ncbi:MAG TPA: hypothetical protein VFS20_00675 [Longimicrobium sp.]|nr:hypothetical protein [Longimicrobium sp.]
MSACDGARRRVLAAFGARGEVADELLRYNQSPFGDAVQLPPLPLDDEPFVGDWERYRIEAEERGVWPVIRQALVQLRFPIAAGTSTTPAYEAATRAGAAPPEGPGVELEAPGDLRLFLHPTAAGRIPVLLAGTMDDFRSLVRALTRKNEPVPLPASMGAAMVAGYNNWERVARLRAAWEAGEIAADGAEDWSAAFRVLRGRKELYQDRFVLLGPGPYSGVPAREMGMGEDEWRAASVAIRLEHECAHYFTRRVLGSMRNNLLDELIADYVGIASAAGGYRAGWFLRFMGLEGDGYREGGRLQNYRGDPVLSDTAFSVLQSLVRAAAAALETADAQHPGLCATAGGRARAIAALAALTLEEMADDDGADRIAARMAGEALAAC